MDFLWKVILACLWLGFHCTGGYVHNRHEIEKRDILPTVVNQTLIDFGVPADWAKSLLTPIANIAEKLDVNLPYISSYVNKS